MTKAKEVLKVLTKKGTAFLSENDMETIRKALELLDKVEQGGDNSFGMKGVCGVSCKDYNQAIDDIHDKYILIERE